MLFLKFTKYYVKQDSINQACIFHWILKCYLNTKVLRDFNSSSNSFKLKSKLTFSDRLFS